MKYIFGFIGALISVTLIGVLALVFLVKPTFIKSQITDWVHNNTDRELTIQGDMHWTFLPHLGLSANNVTLSNPKKFGAGDFANAKNMTISLEITPLLRKEFSIGKVRLYDLTLNLIKNKGGHGNWEFKKEDKTPTAPASNEAAASGKSSGFQVQLHKIIFKNSTVHFHNQLTGHKTTLTNVNAHSTNFRNNKPFRVSADFTTDKENQVSLEGKAQYNADKNKLNLKDFELRSSHSTDAMNTFSIYTTGYVDFDKQQFSLKPLKFEFANELSGSGTINGSDIFKKALIEGDIHTNDFNLQQLLSNIGQPVKFKNKNALKSVKLKGRLSVQSNKIIVKDMTGSIDDMNISGSLSYLLGPGEVSVNIVGSTLNLDKYAMRKGENRIVKAAKKMSGTSKKSSGGNTTVKGSLQFKSVRSGNIQLANMKTQFKYQNKVLSLSPFSAGIFQGNTNGSITVSTKGTSPYITIRQQMSNVSLEKMLQQITGSNKLTGRAIIKANINFSGGNSNTVKKTLSGTVSIKSNNGIIRGTDIDHQFAKKLGTVGGKLPAGPDRGYTPYKDLTATIAFENGILLNHSLLVNLEHFHLKGDGKLNMLNHGLNYNLGVKAYKPIDIKTKVGSADLSQYYIPLRITGTVDNPKVSMDFTDVLKLTIKKQADILINNKVKEKVQDAVGDILKKALPSF